MEPRNFSSPDTTENSREARLTKLRERRTKGGVGNGETILRPVGSDAKPRSLRSPEPIVDQRFEGRADTRPTDTRDTKLKSLPNRQGRSEVRPDQRFDNKLDNKLDNKNELKARRKSNRPQPPLKAVSKSKAWGWQVLRLAIAGLGLSVIAGTAISFWQTQQSLGDRAVNSQAIVKEEISDASPEIVPLELTTEATSLLTKIKELAAKDKDLSMQMIVTELDSGSYVQIDSSQPIAAASTIKIPLLVAFFQDVDAGKIKLDELLEMTEDVIVGEAGDFQFLPVGTKITALETATQMIVISDNTATNMVLKRLGGAAAVNQRFKSWGLTATVINNPLPDLEGTNTISTKDMVTLFAMIDRGKLVQPRSRDRLMDIMRRPVTNTLLPQGIGKEARIIHKTGDIGSAVGDAGIVDMPNGKRYAIAVMVKRPDNDQRANELIRQVSKATYEYFRSGGSLPASATPNENLPANPPQPDSDASDSNNGNTNIIESLPLPLPIAPSATPEATR